MVFLCDKKILIGIGIGIIIGTLSMTGFSLNDALSRSQIEEKAKGYGMHYSDECKVIFSKDVKK